MTNIEKEIAQEYIDTISQMAALLKSFGLPTDGIYADIQKINIQIIMHDSQYIRDEAIEQLIDAAYPVRQSLHSGGVV